MTVTVTVTVSVVCVCGSSVLGTDGPGRESETISGEEEGLSAEVEYTSPTTDTVVCFVLFYLVCCVVLRAGLLLLEDHHQYGVDVE